MVLPHDPTQVVSASLYPYLQQKTGHDIITASGLTLLGADDKAGVAIIMDFAHYLLTHPEVPHGTIRLLFTPDEEVGRGTSRLDMGRLAADYGYTLDGGEAGDLEDETFSANGVEITISGVSIHPGIAKVKMINALKLAAEVLTALPKNEWSPETTEGYEGFVHPVHIEGNAEEARLQFIVRDFDTRQLAVHEARLRQLAAGVISQYPGAAMRFSVTEQYRNMKEVLQKHPQVVAHAKEAIRRAGLQVRMVPIRGGTDGSRLSFMGLPCPNLFTGMQGIHSKTEWVSVQDMQKAVETLVHLAMVWEEQASSPLA